MRSRYAWAGAIGAIGVGVAVAAVLAPDLVPDVALFVPAVASPLAVLLAVWGRVGGDAPVRAAAGGALIGPLVAAASHAFVAAFAYAFFLGFADTGRALVETLRLDPRVVDLVSSPWVVLLIVELVVVAPLTEEAGKALGARGFGRPGTRRDAFLAGVAAGAGFAAVENVLYAALAAAFGGPWPAVVLARTAGAAVHALATGLVLLGWWDSREGAGGHRLLTGFLSGAGVHALWNGTLVVLVVARGAYALGDLSPLPGAVELAFAAALGAVLAASLWALAGAVATGRAPTDSAAEARTVAAWLIVTASLVVPIAVVTIAFPALSG